MSGKIAANKYFKIINLVLVGLVLFYLWHRLKQINTNDFVSVLSQGFSTKNGVILFAIILFLMLVNWSLESLKWKLLLSPLSKINYSEAVKSVLAGLTISVFTPNRTGEVIGKVFYLDINEKMKAGLLNFSGSLAQMIFTCIAGLWSGYILSSHYSFQLPYFIHVKLLFYIAIIATFAALIIYFNQLKFLTWVSNKKWAKKIDIAFTDPKQFNNILQLKIFVLAGLRYLVFVSQLVCLLYFCQIFVSFPIAFLCCSVYFFLVWFLPSIAVFELGMRGSVALFLFNNYSTNQAGIILASTLLWAVNIALPALLGTIYVYKIKWQIK